MKPIICIISPIFLGFEYSKSEEFQLCLKEIVTDMIQVQKCKNAGIMEMMWQKNENVKKSGLCQRLRTNF